MISRWVPLGKILRFILLDLVTFQKPPLQRTLTALGEEMINWAN
jgi:hypothetical protein